MFRPVIWLDFRLMALHWCVLPKLFDKHHTGSVSCQLACDVVVGSMDRTGRRNTVEMLTNMAVVGTWTGQDDGHN